MKNISKAIIATMLLTGAAFSANAADASHATKLVDLTSGAARYGSSFTSGLAKADFADKFSFTVNTKSLLAADVTSTAASASVGLDLTAFAVYTSTGTLLYSGVQKSSGRVDNWKLNTSNLVLDAGSYYVQVLGKINSAGAGSLSGNISLKALAVPEAETYAMLLAGLGLVGFVARRNKRA